MSKLYFKFGAMNSSKTANALMTKFNYEEKGWKVWLIKPSIDTRDNQIDENGNVVSVVRSRIGLSAITDVIEKNDNIYERIKSNDNGYNVIICDECQFLTENQVDELKRITIDYNIPVLCFGLRSDFQTKLFPGSKRLFEIADSITEIKSICKCGTKAIVNARFDASGQVVVDGNQIEIGGNEKYESMCWKCWQKLIAERKK
ncbi:MAG: thymidine kinase [Ruminococcaceae bacterium]|nr:thymidine kinase [Oscillospiraceae bacterium]